MFAVKDVWTVEEATPYLERSWLKSVWEKASRLNIEIQLAPLPLQPPRERDTWITAEFL
jgi:hypothetical protein